MRSDLPDDLDRLGQTLGAARAAQVPVERGQDKLAARLNALHDELHDELHDDRRRPTPRASTTLNRIGQRSWIAVGVFSLLVLASIGVHHIRHSVHTNEQRYVTHAGERRNITLADGSRVALAPNTVLIVARNFAEVQRDVSLTGEAYFTVNNVARTSFTVHTGRLQTRVLGTTFDVLHNPHTQQVRIAVISGRVAFGTHATTVLHAGSIAHASDSVVTVQSNADVSAYAEWPTDRLRFRDAAVGDVLATVGQWYGVQFRLQDSTVAQDRVTATFDYSTRDAALLALRTLLNVTMTFNGDVITLHPRSVQRSTPSLRRSAPGILDHSMEIGR